jgi:hypothetical protein
LCEDVVVYDACLPMSCFNTNLWFLDRSLKFVGYIDMFLNNQEMSCERAGYTWRALWMCSVLLLVGCPTVTEETGNGGAMGRME